MKSTIEQIDVYVVKLPMHYRVGGHEATPNALPGTDYYVEPQWVHAYSSRLEACLVKVTASDGTAGWGEAQAPLVPEVAATLITTLLGPALLGTDSLAISAQYHRLSQLMLARGHVGSFLSDAIAGLDIALWDLKGRRHGAPIFELLGGPFSLRLPAYVSGLRVEGVDAKAALAADLMNQGFAGVKLFTGQSASAVEEEVRAIRKAIGPEALLAVDAICRYSIGEATQVGGVLDQIRAAWFEAPLAAEDVDGHAALARRIATPIAVGETLRTARQFLPWLRRRALAIAQPDVMRAGITGAVQIAAQNDAAHVPTALHTGVCTGIGMAATWQTAAGMPSPLPQEHQHHLFDAVTALLATPLKVERGTLLAPTGPGLGVDVNEQAVADASTEHWRVMTTGRVNLTSGST